MSVIRPIVNLIRNYRKLGHKKFMAEWRTGIMKVPQGTILKINIASMIGMIFAFLFAGIMAVLFGNWYFAPIFVFAIALNVSNLIKTYQQYNIVKNIPIQFADLNKLLEKK